MASFNNLKEDEAQLKTKTKNKTAHGPTVDEDEVISFYFLIYFTCMGFGLAENLCNMHTQFPQGPEEGVGSL